MVFEMQMQMLIAPYCGYQIKREISTMKLIKHPNVIKIYEVLCSFFHPLLIEIKLALDCCDLPYKLR